MSRNIFNTVMFTKPKRNHFDLSYDRKFSLDSGKLVPIHLMEVIPGDKINMSSEQMIRMAPMVAPVMHKVDVYTHFFFVPNRILWPNWEDFIAGGEDGAAAPVFPKIAASDNPVGSVADYFGLPTHDGSVEPIQANALPFAAYNKIYNEFYRDQNLQEKLNDTLVDGDNTNEYTEDGAYPFPLERAWQHDYFTAALPFAQKGPEATLPLGTSAPIDFVAGFQSKVRDESGTMIAATEGLGTNTAGPSDGNYVIDPLNVASSVAMDNSESLEVDLSAATASSINDLRRAFRLQEWLEKNARGGSRYIENILAHFGVRSSDKRLQRPEYLGGGKSPVLISEVLQMSESVNTPQGNLSGHGINVGSSHSFSYFAEEHGFIIGIMSVMPKPAYQQGIHRQWSKFDKFDYFWPSFAHIGEQEVKNQELFWSGEDDENLDTFGYVPRYAEYRYLPSSVHGDFRETLSYWHWGRIFESRPYLNSDFIKCDPGKRIFAVQDLPDDGDGEQPVRSWNTMYCHIFHKIHAKRPIPKWGIPSGI